MSDARAARRARAVGAGRRLAAPLDLLYLIAVTEFQPHLPRHRARLPVVARAAAAAVRASCSTVFTQAFDLGDRVQSYPVLLLFNIVLFGFFQEATTQAVSSIVSQESVVRKTQFPRLVIPLAVVLTRLFNLAVNLVVVLVFLLAAGVGPPGRGCCSRWSCSPARRADHRGGAILAALYPRFRDTGIIWGVAATALFYATPVLYPLDIVPGGCAICSRSTRSRRCSSSRASG